VQQPRTDGCGRSGCTRIVPDVRAKNPVWNARLGTGRARKEETKEDDTQPCDGTTASPPNWMLVLPQRVFQMEEALQKR
jgi:hypothetical protein